ncbi:MAG: protein kinase [Pirellulaceae bacterium]|nr:protein kinase [Pirellulaceae bacterium]
MKSAGTGDSSNQQLNAILADYLLALESKEQPDREQLLKSYPEFADLLRDFFHDHDKMMARGSEVIQEEAMSQRLHRRTSSANSAMSRESAETDFMKIFAEFGEYQLLDEIDRGGMGVIYRARQSSLDRIVALKMIKSGQFATAEEIARFHLEAEAAASLDHAAIVSIYEVGERQGIHFFSMQYVEGCTLASRLAEGPMEPCDAACLILKIAQAVAYAHSKDIVHRDLKPANVLLDNEGDPHLTDFGLAKRMTEDNQLTMTGQILGTPAFMAPEQASARVGDLAPLVDVYAIGALLYTTLTGKQPFEAENEIDLLLKLLDQDPVPPTKVNRRIPKSLEMICLQCMEKNPERRYSSVAAVTQDLQSFLREEPLQKRSDDLAQSIRRWWRREPVLVTHATAILGFLSILQLYYVFQGGDLNFHLKHELTFFAWFLLCFGLQKMLNHPKWANCTQYLWASVDLFMLTLILVMAHPPIGALLIGYPVLISASGLFARARLVAFTTVISIIAYSALMGLRSIQTVGVHYHLFHALGLAVVGFIVSTQVRRIRALSRFYGVSSSMITPKSFD